ncbi:AAA family ATPase [candidate division KSB1 bacterium]|nr:AAA family ATPase [candidate division KSB1 bacterium]
MKKYPFAAVVGQEKMKKALLLNLINPKIGGVLIKGEKGTAKSTIVRGLADLVSGLKVVELPLGATEDKVVGTLDIEHAIKKGEKRFEPGILSKAHGNILYVDEINLLDDNIVDILLDVAAMGVNTVEREGISHSHPSQFILIGTMNPEEGDLRPQLLDRFGLTIDVVGESDVANRVEVIKRRLAFEQTPDEFAKDFSAQQLELSNTIISAQDKLSNILFPEYLYECIASISCAIGVDGHRADITMLKTALTIAAFYNCVEVTEEHIYEAAELVLPHRLLRTPFSGKDLTAEEIRKVVEKELLKVEVNS